MSKLQLVIQNYRKEFASIAWCLGSPSPFSRFSGA